MQHEWELLAGAWDTHEVLFALGMSEGYDDLNQLI